MKKAEKRESLLKQLLAEGKYVENPCNGKGICGKCKVKILNGDAGKITETEKHFLSTEELEQGIRLACMVVPEEKLEVEILQKDRKTEVLSEGYVPEFDIDTDIEKCVVNLRKPSLKDQTSLEDQLLEQLRDVKIPVNVLQKMELQEGIYTAVIWKNEIYNRQEKVNGKELLDLEIGDQTGHLYGAAIDIGTTTVVVSVIDMMTGKELGTASSVNAQKVFGLDVLTRISYENEHPETGKEELQKEIVDSINEMLEEACRKAGTIRNARIRKSDIHEITVAANCTMMHMLLGVSAKSIGKSPYAPVFVKAKNLRASEIGIQAGEGARLYCLPSVSAYIGADIVAGAYVCELRKKQEAVLFIDIGTNGEIVFSDHGRLLSCSCAAGPALEGMNISSGMRAADGAIEDVKITEQGIKLQVIGQEKSGKKKTEQATDGPEEYRNEEMERHWQEEPTGICGSGILAVVKELRRTGLIRKDGAFIKLKDISEEDYRYPMLELDGRKRKFKMTEKLRITQGDVRQVQLAKGAILSGFYALLKKAGKTMEDLDQVMIAGQFGAHLPAESLIGTGILPKEVKDKLVYVGNSSKTGAYLALMSGKAKKEMEELAHHMEYMELGATEGYERLFADCLMFPDEAEIMK